VFLNGADRLVTGYRGERIDDSEMLVFNSIRPVIRLLRNRHPLSANKERQFRKAAFDTIVQRQWRRPTWSSFVTMSFKQGFQAKGACGRLPRLVAHRGSREKHSPKPGPKRPPAVQAMSREFLSELLSLEAVGSGVLCEGAQHPAVENMARDLLEQQTPAGTKDPRDLGDGLLPLLNVVDDPKVDNGVERSGRVSNLGGVPGAEQQGLCGTIPQPPLGTFHHRRVKVEGSHMPRPEPVEQYLDPDAAAAADLQDIRVPQVAVAQLSEPGRFPVVLVGSAKWVVHCQPLNGVELHYRTTFRTSINQPSS